MSNILLMAQYTLREALARKVFIAFFIMSSLAILVTFLVFLVADFVPDFGEGEDFREIVMMIQLGIIYFVNSLGLLLAIFSTSGFMPHLLEKGTVDLFLSRPLSRLQILLGRYLGGVIVVFLNIAYSVLGIWAIISLNFGYWNFNFILIIFTITFVFASLYSLMIFLGVLTKSGVPGMMAAYFTFIILSPILAAREGIYEIIDSQAVKLVLDTVYYIVPKTSELFGKFSEQLVTGEGNMVDLQPVISTLLFTAVLLAASIAAFKKKDF